MDIIFVKKFVDTDSFDQPITIEIGDCGILLDSVTGRIEFDDRADYPIHLEGIPEGSYIPVL